MAETIQGHILRRHRPEFLEVVNVNTGTRIGAGRWAQRLAALRQRVLSKLRVPGYQPYERLALWLRRELRPLVEDLLLSERCLDRGIFNPDMVRELVDRYLRYDKVTTALVTAVMTVELAQRILIDDDGRASRNR